MTKKCFPVSAALAAILALACATPPPPRTATDSPPASGSTAVQGTIAVPRLPYRARTLTNGLQVVSLSDRTTPTVAIQVWYHVGSKDDPEGRSGFAHLFEHLMFKRTKNMPDEMLDRLTEDVGGYNNASTGDDVTIYYEVVPSNHLERLLWAEADRLATLQVDEKPFRSERDVVKEEFRQRVLSPPYGRLFYALDTRSFAVHPYRRPGIGSIEQLEASSLADVQAFHRTFYRPDNATLVVVGDFEDAAFDRWVDRYFAPIAKPAAPMPRVTVTEPARSGERRFQETGPNVPLPAIALTFLGPDRKHADAPALRLLETVLATGESSRLHRSLVYEQQLAQEADADVDLKEGVGLITLYAILAGGKTPADGEKALLAEIEKVSAAPVTAAELERAKNQALTGAIAGRETNEGKARRLGDAAVLLGDPERANTEVGRLQAVTAADIQRVARTYLTARNRVVITYEEEKKKEAAQ